MIYCTLCFFPVTWDFALGPFTFRVDNREAENEDSEEERKDYFAIEFCFDCDCACYVQIHFCATEVVQDGKVQ